MQEVIDGFLKFQREAFVERTELFKRLATSQNPRTLIHLMFRQPIGAGADHPTRTRRPVRHPQRRQYRAFFRA